MSAKKPADDDDSDSVEADTAAVTESSDAAVKADAPAPETDDAAE